MANEYEGLSEEGVKRKAYLEGLKLKNSGLSIDIIYARLEKKGVPEELARKVANDVYLERRKTKRASAKEQSNVLLIKISAGIVLAIISAILVPERIVLPIGIIVSALIYAFTIKDWK